MVLETHKLRQHLVTSLGLLYVLLLPSVLHSQDAETSPPISAELHYPEEVAAGNAFQLEASVTNTGAQPLLITVSLVCPFTEISGAHRPSFRAFDNPLRPANHESPALLQPGQTEWLSLRSFHYEAETLFSGDLVLSECALRISDRYQDTMEQSLSPVHIRITHEGSPQNVSSSEPPDRLPLERRFDRKPDAEIPWMVYDPNTQLEWLPLTATQGQSLLQVMEQLQEGGRFEGFAVASLPELMTLVMNALHASGKTLPEYALTGRRKSMDGRQTSLAPLAPAASTINHLFGITHNGGLPDRDLDSSAGFLLGTADEPRAVLEASVSHVTNPTSGGFTVSPQSRLWPSSYQGVWLRRDRRQGEGP